MWPQIIDYKFLIYGHKFPQYLANNTKQILTIFIDRWDGKENYFGANPIQTYVTHMSTMALRACTNC